MAWMAGAGSILLSKQRARCNVPESEDQVELQSAQPLSHFKHACLACPGVSTLRLEEEALGTVSTSSWRMRAGLA